MNKVAFLAATALSACVTPAFAQTAASPTTPNDETVIGDIIVTAQRQAETLQTVPIAVSAFSAQTLREQQINTTSDLQLTLPNITFSKNNFTSSSSFTIRGIGDLCVGVACDNATAVHVNDVPVIGSPIFQSEYFDVERIEVLRGPQGTLYGRNATAGVINFITAKPDLSAFGASGEIEYGNFESIRVKGMVNLPLGDVFGVRLAGYYLKRDGFTRNLATGGLIDGRDQFDIRGSIRFQPTADTTFDIVAHWYREKSDRSRNQKQLCNRDPSGILGCLPDRLDFGQLNGNATLANVLTSREFFTLNNPALAPFALGSVYGPDGYAGFVNPADLRAVRVDFEPRNQTEERQVLAHLEHDFGSVGLSISGSYTEGFTDSSVDYNLGIQAPLANNPGILTLAGAASLPGSPFAPVAAALIPQGPGGPFCQSTATESGTGVYGGNTICAPTSLDFDRSTIYSNQWSVEGILETKFDGAFNFLIGGIYLDYKARNNDYYVNSFLLDYAGGVLGAGSTGGAAYFGTPFFDNDSRRFGLKSYGIFGEAYVDFSDRAKLTVGLRYNNDKKALSARTTLYQDSNGGATTVFAAVPFGATNFTQALNYAALDFDPTRPGRQEFADNDVSFSRLTGRAVLDFQITPRNLVYLSYSRGYKSGGINPPLSPIFDVPNTFGPETVDAFEIGSKNTFLGGTLRLNLTAFYYKYKNLQLSRIVARTSVNDNVDASIYGLEAEAIVKPARDLLVNLNFSYLKTKVVTDKFLGNPQDPSGGRADAVIIKDLTNASNCAVGSNGGSAAASNGFVGTVNQFLSLQAPTPLPGTTTTGAFGVCGILQAAAAGDIGAASAALAAPNPALGGLTPQQFLNFTFTGSPAAGPLPFTVFSSGVPVNIRGNALPQSPEYKFSSGIQYTGEFSNGMSLVPRFDLAYTGNYFGSIFNKNINRIQGYLIMNAQIQLNGAGDRWFVRGFVQNLANNNAITGLYVTDQSSGLFTNAFTLEPRRYGIAAGFRF
ncbi:MAG: TonB-dependent receptor [Sphingomonadaceae bacterium]